MSKGKTAKRLLVFVMSLALVAGFFVNPKTTMKAEAAHIEENYTPADGDVDNGLVKIDTTAKTIWVQHDSEHGARNIYTFSGYSGYSVTIVSVYNLQVTLADGTYEVDVDTTYENPAEPNGELYIGANAIIAEITGITVNYSYGIIEVNNAGIGANYGSILVNNGTISSNYGSIAENSYYGGVDKNYGIISSQSGMVNSNQLAGLIEDNTAAGWIGHNYGHVTVNNGEIATNEPPGRVHENFGTIIADNAVYDTYSGTIAEANSRIEAMEEKLAKGEQVKDATVYLTEGDSLPLSIMKTLKNCPGVSLDFRCTYNGEDLHFVIKGGKDLIINEDIPWYGPLYLKSLYGVVGNTANTYLIRPGDTLNGISKKLGISIAELLKKNPRITNPDRIRAGQVLNY